ncbi:MULTISPECIES: hypothetical protein [Clostridium]|uniref:Uncharacterized protein n=1 Tax=Clostridium beijerinckii TaxID=1520 RepID=A0A1S9N600_CLOBE|nr:MULTISPECIES: hypothetical protein [Clostridium]EKQ57730.1 MAG: hypothetical protein A370_00617 [Clostridium sp. Maddingley MBC34-26]MZK52593.1 hypothetical protein [Clostridium beijerinckii]MZK60631.1 hypothetical protein [Clostridium beijerinckii]MZK70906.1 hypothetical protein [Clostridium beijerinckii]MZK76261.1 hypothetical protein [Clostridium beijerinckii]
MDRCEILKFIDEMEKYRQAGGKRSQNIGNILKRTLEIKDLINEKFALVFVTDKGIGKTSIINYLLDLSYEREKKLKSGRKTIVYQDVLETGAGATTTSETEIVQAENDYCEIEIIPVGKEEMEELLRGFAQYIFKEIYAEFKGYSSIAPEIFRAMRNMTGLKEVDRENGDKIDLAKELAKGYDMHDYLLFEDEIFRRANLQHRIKNKFIIDRGSEEKKSIRSIFNKINLMSMEDIPLPKKVIVKLSKDIFDFNTLGCIDRIIDTRGLESGVVATDRKDIRELFKKDKNKVVVLVDKFNSPSQSIMRLVDTYIQEGDYETQNRVAYLVNFRDGEPENVVSHSGKTYSEIRGIDIKCEDIHKYIKGNNINLKLDNIIFTNPKRFLDANGKMPILEEDIEDYGDAVSARKAKQDIREEKKRELWDDIYRITENYRKELINELSLKSEEFKSIKNKEIEELNIDFEQIVTFINDFNVDNKNVENFPFTIFEEYILNCHHSTLMALNNRHGVYSNRDIYLVGSDKIEKLFRSSLKDITLNVINLILNQVSTEEEKKVIMIIINDVKRYCINFMDEINSFAYEYLRNNIFNKEQIEFWKKTIERWGKGSPYTLDIDSYYKEQLEKEKLDKYIRDAATEWIRTFKNGLIAVIEEFA